MPASETGDLDAESLRRHAVDPRLGRDRAKAASEASTGLRRASQYTTAAARTKDAPSSTEQPLDEGADDALVGIAVLTRIAADLIDASGTLLTGTNHYAGAALLRQIVEVEYLTWAFANEKRDAAVWINSTREDRRRMFSPAGLRDLSDGHFIAADYGHHCEQGGHPVPQAIPLLANTDPSVSQLLLVDLLLHGWRTSDNLASWARKRGLDRLAAELESVQKSLWEWGQTDPLYTWAVRQRGTGSPPS